MTDSIQDRAARAAEEIWQGIPMRKECSTTIPTTRVIIADAFAGMLVPADVVQVLVKSWKTYQHPLVAGLAARLDLTAEFEKALEDE